MIATILTGFLLSAPPIGALDGAAAQAPLSAVSSVTLDTGSDGTASLFPAATEDLALGWAADSDGLTMLEVVRLYGAATGQRMAIKRDTLDVLQSKKAPLDRPLSIPAAEVQSTFEALLRAADCVLTVELSTGVDIAGVHSLEARDRSVIRRRARRVAASDLDVLRAHPAVLFTTVVELPNSDVRQLSNSLRTMIVDSNIQQLLPAGSSNSMLVTGPGPFVADLVEHLQEIDAATQATSATVAHEVVRLRHANAAEIAPIVEAAMTASRQLRRSATRKNGQAPKDSEPMARVQPNARLNAVIVTCLKEDVAEARSILSQLDVE